MQYLKAVIVFLFEYKILSLRIRVQPVLLPDYAKTMNEPLKGPSTSTLPEEPIVEITAAMKADMRTAARWSRTVAIASIALNGLMLLGAMITVVVVFVFPDNFGPGMDVSGLVMGYVIVGLLALFYLYTSVLLYRYSQHLKRYTEQGTQSTFEAFIFSQQRFWQLFGRSLAGLLGLYFLAILVFGILVA